MTSRHAPLLILASAVALLSCGAPAGAAVPARAPHAAPPRVRSAHAATARRPTPSRAVLPVRPASHVAADARAAEDLGAYGRAAELLRELDRSAPPDADRELALALDEARSGRVDSALARFDRPVLVAAARDTTPYARRHAYNFVRDAQWVDGGFGGWNWYVLRGRAELLVRKQRWAEALPVARACAAARPVSGREWHLLALCEAHTGAFDDATRDAEHAVALEPSLPEAHELAGLLAWRGGRRAAAHQHLRAAAALDSAFGGPAFASALMRSMTPGTAPDHFPDAFLTGDREVGLLTSPARPKIEEQVQMDEPARVLSQQMVPLPDSIQRRITKRLELVISVFVDEHGRPVWFDLPWLPTDAMPSEALGALIASIRQWEFAPGVRMGERKRTWAGLSVTYGGQP